jgi:hypothetical protein
MLSLVSGVMINIKLEVSGWSYFLMFLFDCRLFKSNSSGRPFGPLCGSGDRIGCGVNFGEVVNDDPFRQMVPVLFTRNGKEV